MEWGREIDCKELPRTVVGADTLEIGRVGWQAGRSSRRG